MTIRVPELASGTHASAADTGEGASDVKVKVTAEDAKGRRFVFSASLPRLSAVRNLRRRWAGCYAVPEHAVGLADAEDKPIDTELTPEALGWPGPPAVIPLSAFPLYASLGENWQKPDSVEGQSRKRPARVPLPGGRKRGRPQASGKAGVADDPVESAAVRVPSLASPAVVAAVPAVPAVAEAAAGSQPSALPAPSGAAPAEPAPDAAASNAVSAGKTAISASPAKPKKGDRVAGGQAGDQPGMNEAIVYMQENPKKLGTAGWTRYEGYKSATTAAEALTLGSAKGDLAYDWKKGFYQRAASDS